MLSDSYNQTFQRFTKGNSDPTDTSPVNTNVGLEFKGSLNNKGGSLPLQGGKLTVNFDSKIMTYTTTTVNDTEWIRHIESGVEYKILRINPDTGYYGVVSDNAHQSIYLEVNK